MKVVRKIALGQDSLVGPAGRCTSHGACLNG